jgi:Tol biopolymer transport system component
MKHAGNFIALLATVAALVAAPAAQAAHPAGIAFARTAAGSSVQIFRASPGGKGEALLAAPRGDLPTAPSFSRDGSRLAFERQARIGYGNVVIARADGSGARTLPGDGHHPSFSPDGRSLVLDSGGYVYTEALDGSHRTLVAEGGDPEFSPDGRRIAFVRDGDIYVNLRRLTFDGANAGPTWSPDGKRIAFWHTGANDTVQTIAANGTGRRSLHQGMQPAWSPDGTSIAFASYGGVWTMRPDGTRGRLLVRNGFLPAWQPAR